MALVLISLFVSLLLNWVLFCEDLWFCFVLFSSLMEFLSFFFYICLVDEKRDKKLYIVVPVVVAFVCISIFMLVAWWCTVKRRGNA